ncbi:hypothetical protein [Maribacter sp. IgM3_T14_3]|uniref:hypothetical protein n=1 Tax=Maribacter sp. IgM3_T14_3 TaxID=3415140 RepID=UPI003C6F5821
MTNEFLKVELNNKSMKTQTATTLSNTIKFMMVLFTLLISGISMAQTTVTLEDQCNCEVLQGTDVSAPGVTTPAGADLGDLYVNTDTGTIYYWNGTTWELTSTDDQQLQNFTFDISTNILSLEIEDGNIVTADLSSLNLVEALTTLVANTDGTFTYTDEDGVDTIIDVTDLETLTTIALNADDTNIDYTDEDGLVTQLDLSAIVSNLEALTTLVANTDGTLTYTDEDGVATIIDIANLETLTTIALNADNTNIDYTDEDGVVTQLDLSAIVSNLEALTTLVANTDGTLTYTDEDGVDTIIDVTDLETLTTIALNADDTNIDYTDEDGLVTQLDLSAIVSNLEALTTLVANTDGTLTYTDEDGVATIIDVANLETLTTIALNADNTNIDYTDEDGLVTQLDLSAIVANLEALTTVVANTDGTFTYTDEDGIDTIIDVTDLETLTTIALNADDTNIDYTDEDGLVTQLDLSAIVANLEALTTVVANTDGTFTYTDEDGVDTIIDVTDLETLTTIALNADDTNIDYTDEDGLVTQLDLSAIVANLEALTTVVANTDGTFTYTDEDGVDTIIDVTDLETLTTIALNADNTNIDYTDEDGLVTQLDLSAIVANLEALTTVVANTDGTFTYTDEDGIDTIIDVTDLETLTTIALNADDTNIDYTDEDGLVTQLDLSAIVANLEALTTVVANTDGTFTYTDEDGVDTIIDVTDLETLTIIALNADNTNIDYTDEDGVTTQIDLTAAVQNLETVTILNTTDNITYTYTSEDTTTTSFDGTDDQNAEEVPLVTPTDFDGDTVNETNVEEALNAISNSGEWIDGTTTATSGDGILAKQADANGATVFVGDNGKVRMMDSDFDTTLDDVTAFEAPIFKKYSTDAFGANSADQMFERSNFRINPNAGDIRYTGLRPNLVVDPGYSGSSLVNLRGIWSQTVGDGTAGSSINTIFGITGAATNQGEGTIGTLIGIYGLPIAESGIVNEMNALLAQPIARGTGAATNVRGLYVMPIRGGSATFENLYGIDVSNQVNLSTNNNYGMRIGNISGAANNYSIYTNTGQVSFGDELQLRTVNPGSSTDQILTIDALGVVQSLSPNDINTDNQNADEVNLATPLDVDGDLVNETTVEEAIADIVANSSDNQDLTGANLNESNQLQINIENGASTTVDLSSLSETVTAGTGAVTVDDDGNGNYTVNSTDTDEDETNELAVLASGPPSTNGVNSGDTYVDTDNGQLYAWDGTTWQQVGGSAAPDADPDPENELSDISLTNTTLELTNPAPGATGVDLNNTFAKDTELSDAITASEALDLDKDDQNELQDLEDVLTRDPSAGGIVITDVGTPVNANDAVNKAYVDNLADDDVSVNNTTAGNRIATISEPGITAVDINESVTTLSDADGDGIFEYVSENTTTTSFDGTDDQNASEVSLATPLDVDGDLVNETTVEEAIADLANSSSDNQDLELNSSTNILSLTNDASTVDLTPYVNDDTNEIQDLELTGNNLTLTNDPTATAIDLSDYRETVIGINDITVTNDGSGNFTVDYVDGDKSDTNEIQNAAEVDLATPIDVDGDTVNETTVEEAIADLANNSSDNQNLTGATLNGANQLQIGIDRGSSTNVDLSSLSETVTAGTGAVTVDDDGNGNYTVNSTDTDEDETNEIQDLTYDVLTQTLNITNNPTASDIDLSALVNTDEQTLSVLGDQLTITTGNTVTLPNADVTDNGDGTSTIEDIDGNSVTVDNDGVDNVDDADNVIGNEYNTGSTITDGSLEITDGGGTESVNLISGNANNDLAFGTDGALYLNVASVTITETITTLADNGDGSFTYNNESGAPVSFQASTITDNGDGTSTIGLADGGTITVDNDGVDNVDDADNNPTNEIQTVASGDGSVAVVRTDDDFDLSVTFPTNNDNDPRNEITTVADNGDGTSTIEDIDGNSVTVDNDGVDNVDDADNNPTNEIQTVASGDGSVAVVRTDDNFDLSVTFPTNNDNDPRNEITTVADNGDGTSTIEDIDGNSVTVDNDGVDNIDDADNNPTNEIQTVASGDGSVAVVRTDDDFDLSVTFPTNNDNDPRNEITTVADNGDGTSTIEDIDGNSVTVDNDGVDNVDDADSEIGNEYNTGSAITDGSLEITDGGGTESVNLISTNANNDLAFGTDGALYLNVASVTISETVTTLADNGDGSFTYTNESGAPVSFQASTITNNGDGTSTVALADGGSIILDNDGVDNVDDADNDPNNEIELPNGGTNGQVLSTDGSGTYTWVDADTGPQGPVGPAGADGNDGATGATGPQGIPGNDGATGAQGPAGPVGPAGADGNDGATGATGPRGIPGNDGATGAQGPAGPVGPAGADGNDGATGATGPQGPAGTDGNDGATGPQGIPGNDGATGAQGPAGPVGPAGADGATGATGPQGIPGNDGADGNDGATGATGPQGIPGNDGATGATGAQGPAGPVGPAGADGATGATGPQGIPGNDGADGNDGATGATGPQGPAGADGNDGATGPQGIPGNDGADGNDGATGATGPTGPVGPAGADGATGATGPQGIPGNDGADGADGNDGATGAQGPAGPVGPAGVDGNDGATGATGPQGPTGPAGADGATGATGPQGIPGNDGATGATGPQGPVGPAGQNGQDGQQGPAGQPGQDGQDGATGPTGPAGPQGPVGPAGQNGQDGQQGPAGQPGQDGQDGQTGPTGPTGPAGDPATDDQTLATTGAAGQISITGGNAITLNVNDADSNPSNELQTLSKSGTNITLSNGGGTVSIADNDNNSNNEIQTITSTDGSVTVTPTGINYNLSVPTANGAETIVEAAPDTDISVTGTGTSADPYLIANTRPDIFYPPSIEVDVATTGTGRTIDLHAEYMTQYGTPAVVSAGAPAAIPTYTNTELYYYVTYFDPTVFANVSVSATGIMTYDVIAAPTDYNTLINVVFVAQ